MRIIRDMETARSTLLKRSPAGTVELPPQVSKRISEVFGRKLKAEEVVTRIAEDIRQRGDAAVFEYIEKLDGVRLERLEVPRDEIESADKKVDKNLLASLQIAARRIEDFHLRQLDLLPLGRTELGEGVGQMLAPLERVGVYAPGGTASYPSTVLMTAIPARAAGVDEVILATPPQSNGHVPPLTLAAAQMAGVDRLFSIGGAAAIAALAFGAQSVPRVDKICGPGNIFVMLAKKHLFGTVAIDGLQGPTETVVVADDSANPVSCAADLLAQAEHDELSSAIMITTSESLAGAVSAEVERQAGDISRKQIALKSLEQRGGIVVAGSMDEAVELVNAYAPEHLCLMVKDADSVAAGIRHSGGIFIGESSPEVLGDYVAGPSHVMPTGGTARFSSPVNILDFLKVTSRVELSDDSFKKLGPHAEAIAEAEGLTAHAEAVRKRKGETP
ncbi:MAG: histidinol dehydrogenase [Dehalococcoidia bacterium]